MSDAAGNAVLFVHYGDNWIRGSERVLLDMIGALDRSRYRPVLWCNSPLLADAARALGASCTVDDFSVMAAYLPSRGFGRWRQQVRRARELMRSESIALVHVNSGAPVQWMLPAARLEGVPLVAHIHIGYNRRERHVLLLHQPDALVGCAQATLRELLADGVDPARCTVIPNGIDLERLDSLATVSSEVPHAECTLVSVGSLIPRKGVDVTLRALALLAERGLRPKLLVAGSGPAEADLRALARTLAVDGQVTWAGERADAPALVRDVADIFVLASRDEAMPLTLLEAGAFGKPCIATAVGGVREVIEDSVSGLVVPPENVQLLAAAIEKLVKDAALRQRLGAAFAQRVRDAHGTEAMMRAVSTLHDRLLARRSGRGVARFLPRCMSSYWRYAFDLLTRRSGAHAGDPVERALP